MIPPACIPPIASYVLLFIAPINKHISTGYIQSTKDSQHARYLIQSHASNANAPFRPLRGMPVPFAPHGLAKVSRCSHVENNQFCCPRIEIYMLDPKELRYVDAPRNSTAI